MNRKKKLIQLHKNKLKNPENRLQNSKKDKYISKAERAKIALPELKIELSISTDEDNLKFEHKADAKL